LPLVLTLPAFSVSLLSEIIVAGLRNVLNESAAGLMKARDEDL
jgi:hypothetical protein